ncbi:DNA polymerase I protein [Rhizobium phage RHph_I65]|nr:DNA polymerase I protein [Rhizobium phage RHph_I65]
MKKPIVGQLPLFEPVSEWKAPSMSDLPTSWGNGRVGLDTEFRDDTLSTLGPGVRRGAYICGVSFAMEDGPAFYLPVRHAGGGNLDPNQVFAYLRHQAKNFTGTIVGANLQTEIDFLAEEGVVFSRLSWFRDIQVADPLINELHYNYSMEHIAQRWDMPGKDERLLLEALAAYGYTDPSAKSGIWALKASQVGPYAEEDARLPLKILRRQERAIDEQDLWDIYNLESRVLPVLVKMRRRGVAVSEDRLQQVDQWSRVQQQEAIEAANHGIVNKLSFHDITNSNKLAVVLRELGVDLPKTRTGKDSVTAAILDGLNHPIGAHLRRAKKMSTLRTTFVDGVRKHLTNGRAHCTFNQLRRQKDDGSGETEGAAYGRLSSSNFNFQNQPARDPEIGPMWRSIYIPDGDGLWAALDYSQQEPRQAVHAAVEAGPRLIGNSAYLSACEAARRYREDPTMDFHDMMTRLIHGEDYLEKHGKAAFSQKRKYAKQVFLGLSYGMGGAKLCRDLGLPTAWKLSWKEGRSWRSKLYATYDECAAKAADAKAAGYDCRYWEAAGIEGQEIMDTFDGRVPFVRKMADVMQKEAAKNGYIITLGGRRCRFPEKDGEYEWLHKAFNRRIQGGSADQTKMAMVEMDAQGFDLQLQVHDEVDLTVESREHAERGAYIMENVVQLHVPMKVDVEVGPSWGEAA